MLSRLFDLGGKVAPVTARSFASDASSFTTGAVLGVHGGAA
jgi:hypothetical protein